MDVRPHIGNTPVSDKDKDHVIQSLDILNQHIMDLAAVIVKPDIVIEEKKKIDVITEKVVRPVIKSFYARFILISVTILNILLMYQETKITEKSRLFIFLEILCFVTIVAQIIMKILHNPSILKHSFWIYLDFFNAFSTIMYHITPIGSSLHSFFTYARVSIFLRVVEMFQPSRRLVVAMGKTAGITVTVILLITLFAFITAYLGHSLFSDLSEEWWGNLGQSLYTIFIVLMQSGLPGYHTVEPARKIISVIFYITVSFVGSFVIMNALTGVSYLSFLKAKRDEQRKRELREKQKRAVENDKAVAQRLVSGKRKQIERAPSTRRMDDGKIRMIDRQVRKMRDKMEKMKGILQKIEQITDEVSNRQIDTENLEHVWTRGDNE